MSVDISAWLHHHAPEVHILPIPGNASGSVCLEVQWGNLHLKLFADCLDDIAGLADRIGAAVRDAHMDGDTVDLAEVTHILDPASGVDLDNPFA